VLSGISVKAHKSGSKEASSKETSVYFVWEKMATVRTIQRKMAIDNLSMQSACRAANLHHKRFISW